nr:hypothetical protein [Modestobacter marinus]
MDTEDSGQSDHDQDGDGISRLSGSTHVSENPGGEHRYLVRGPGILLQSPPEALRRQSQHRRDALGLDRHGPRSSVKCGGLPNQLTAGLVRHPISGAVSEDEATRGDEEDQVRLAAGLVETLTRLHPSLLGVPKSPLGHHLHPGVPAGQEPGVVLFQGPEGARDEV